MSFLGPTIMLALIHGLCLQRRSFLTRRRDPEQRSFWPLVEPQLPMLSQPEAEIVPAEPDQKLTQLTHEPVHELIQMSTEPVQTDSLLPPRKESVREWKELRITDRKGSKTLKSAARSDYEAFCSDRGEEPVNATAFGLEINKLGAQKSNKDKRHYYGIVLKTPLKLVKAA